MVMLANRAPERDRNRLCDTTRSREWRLVLPRCSSIVGNPARRAPCFILLSHGSQFPNVGTWAGGKINRKVVEQVRCLQPGRRPAIDRNSKTLGRFQLL